MDKETSAVQQLQFLLDAIELFHQLSGLTQLPHGKLILSHLQNLKKTALDNLLAGGDSDRAALRKETDRILSCCSEAESYLQRLSLSTGHAR